jgi:hypothetical protein
MFYKSNFFLPSILDSTFAFVSWYDFIVSIICRLFKWSIPCYICTLIRENLIDLNYYSLSVNVVFSGSTSID